MLCTAQAVFKYKSKMLFIKETFLSDKGASLKTLELAFHILVMHQRFMFWFLTQSSLILYVLRSIL